jgi:hypothetical protein
MFLPGLIQFSYTKKYQEYTKGKRETIWNHERLTDRNTKAKDVGKQTRVRIVSRGDEKKSQRNDNASYNQYHP